MFKAIKEFFVGSKPAPVEASAAPVESAPYKVPEPAATTSIPFVPPAAPVETPASAYNESYKVEDDHPGATRRVAETVLEVNVQDVATTTAPAKEKAPAKAKAPKLTVVKSEKAPAKPKAVKAPSKKKT